jgi:hypothetical protein
MVSNSSWFKVVKKENESGSKGGKKGEPHHTSTQSKLPQELLDTALSAEQVEEIKRRNPKVIPAKGVEDGGNLKQTRLGDY